MNNSNAIGKLIGVVLAMFLGLYVVQYILTGYGNSLSSLFKVMAIGGFVLGIAAPKPGLYMLVIVSAYLDLLKRCLIVFGRVFYTDIITVLSVAPILLAGICIGILLKRGREGQFLTPIEWKLFWIATVIVGAKLFWAIMATGSLMGGLVYGANAAAYVPLFLFAGMMFASRKEQEGYLRWIAILYIPVALYGMKQGISGLSSFEREYLLSGLSQKVGLLDMALLRPFSTLNSPHSYSVMMVTLFGACTFLGFQGQKWRHFFKVVALLFLATTFFGGVTRTAWGMIAMITAGILFFRSKGSTIFLYGVTGAILLLVVLFSDSLHHSLGSLTDIFRDSNSNWVRRAAAFGTMSERFAGISSWSTSTELWSWFGLDTSIFATEELPHDLIGQILITHGAVGLLASIVLGCSGLYWAHRSVLRISDRGQRGLCVAYLSILFALVVSGMVAGNHTGIFPINFYFWLLIGLLVRAMRPTAEPARTPLAQPGVEPAEAPAPVRARPGRFRPVPRGASPSTGPA